jgi:predicted kinase
MGDRVTPTPVPGLVVIGGLPATGKSTIATAVAAALGASYIRIDTIEQALVTSGELAQAPVAAGYHVGYALTGDQLRVGRPVIAECVNPFEVTRNAWRDVAQAHDTWIVEVELICSDHDEHRRRVETRTSDIPGLALPTWHQVTDREYQPWTSDRLVIDTAHHSRAEAANIVIEHVGTASRPVKPT